MAVSLRTQCAGLDHRDVGLGNSLEHRYTVYTQQPMRTEWHGPGSPPASTGPSAEDLGFKPLVVGGKAAVCAPDTGTPWSHGGKVDAATPYFLHFTAAGQLAAISVDIYGPAASTPAHHQWVTAMNRAKYITLYHTPDAGDPGGAPIGTFTVALRNATAANLCDPNTIFGNGFSGELLGTQVAVLSGGSAFPTGPTIPRRREVTRLLPLTAAGAAAEGYRRGACFDGMGFHYFKDLVAPNGTISWSPDNLMPIVPM